MHGETGAAFALAGTANNLRTTRGGGVSVVDNTGAGGLRRGVVAEKDVRSSEGIIVCKSTHVVTGVEVVATGVLATTLDEPEAAHKQEESSLPPMVACILAMSNHIKAGNTYYAPSRSRPRHRCCPGQRTLRSGQQEC